MAAAAKGEMGSWVSDAAREKFMAAYERVLALWPQPVEALDLETIAATTRVNAYRPRRDGAPVVLLTGARSALITPAQARDRAAQLPNAQVAIVPGSHGGFNRLDALNTQVVTFLQSVGATAA